MKYLALGLGIIVLLSACSIFSPVKSETTTTYILNANPEPRIQKTNRKIDLLVTQPESSTIYNTTDMAFTKERYQIGYFVKNSWAEPPAQMLQPLLIRTLHKTKYFHTVGSLANLGQYNYILHTQLLLLQQDFTRARPVLHLALQAQLLNANTNQVIATKQFSVDEPLRHDDPYSGVIAANQATAKILLQVANFCLKNLKG